VRDCGKCQKEVEIFTKTHVKRVPIKRGGGGGGGHGYGHAKKKKNHRGGGGGKRYKYRGGDESNGSNFVRSLR
jgi:hypothetical protein